MQVSIEEVGVEKIRWAEFLAAHTLADNSLIYFAPLDKKGGPKQKWMVLDDGFRGSQDGYMTVYTTEEMKLLCRSLKETSGRPVRAHKEIGYHFLVRSGKLRMKIRDGCSGCRRFWGGDCTNSQCSICHRCTACCEKVEVPYSCAHYNLNKGHLMSKRDRKREQKQIRFKREVEKSDARRRE